MTNEERLLSGNSLAGVRKPLRREKNVRIRKKEKAEPIDSALIKIVPMVMWGLTFAHNQTADRISGAKGTDHSYITFFQVIIIKMKSDY